MSDIQFWLSFNNGAERLRLPVNPESIKVSSPHSFNDVKVSELGEYTVPGDPELKTYEIISHFPKKYNPTYCEYMNIPDPWETLQTLERWRSTRKPCRLTITGTPINTPVTIRTIDYDAERAGSIGDIYYTLMLKEHKFIEFKTITSEEVLQETSRPNQNLPPTSYTVVSGDSLSLIAAKLGSKGINISWNELYNANKAIIGKNPNLIYPGQKLVIPIEV